MNGRIQELIDWPSDHRERRLRIRQQFAVCDWPVKTIAGPEFSRSWPPAV
jgi:hypothetical protein